MPQKPEPLCKRALAIAEKALAPDRTSGRAFGHDHLSVGAETLATVAVAVTPISAIASMKEGATGLPMWATQDASLGIRRSGSPGALHLVHCSLPHKATGKGAPHRKRKDASLALCSSWLGRSLMASE